MFHDVESQHKSFKILEELEERDPIKISKLPSIFLQSYAGSSIHINTNKMRSKPGLSGYYRSCCPTAHIGDKSEDWDAHLREASNLIDVKGRKQLHVLR